MSHMTIDDFEARYRSDPDPWSYETSDYERAKYKATLNACGAGPAARALELGASVGVFTELLAPRCLSLTTVDAAPTAVAIARRRLADHPHVTVLLGHVPDAIPRAAHDLTIASEILYYLQPELLDRTLDRLRGCLVAGGRLVAVHWRPPGPERPFSADEVHARLREQPWLRSVQSDSTPDYLLDVLERAANA
jgi:cyclopropane fatty-acyl-phospholipid synthase-like methyltransferase